MSQIIKPTPGVSPPPTPFLETLSDNVNTKVNADITGNIQIEGQLNEQIGFFSTVVAANPAPGSSELTTNPMSPARWIVDGLSTTANPNGTHTTIAAAIASALSGDTILILPKGSPYVEDLTLKAGVNLVGMQGDSTSTNVTILGKAIYSGSGTVTLCNIRLQTNGDNLLHVTGSNPSIISLQNVYLNCTNFTGILFDSSNPGSLVGIVNSGGTLGITGISFWTSSSPGVIDIFYSNLGNLAASTTANFSSAGIIGIQYSTFANPIITSGSAAILAGNSAINTNALNVTGLTVNGSTPSDISFFGIASNTASALNIGAGSTINVVNCQITSANTHAIDGSGTLVYDIIDFPGTSSNINSTLTLTPRSIATGNIYNTNGTTALPSYSFNSNRTSGLRTDGTNIFMSVGNNDTIEFEHLNTTFAWLANFTTLAYGNNFQSTSAAAFTANVNNSLYIACDSTSNPITVKLPDAAAGGQVFMIKDSTGQAAENNITVTTVTGAKTFDGATTTLINVAYGSLTVIYNPSTTNYEIF